MANKKPSVKFDMTGVKIMQTALKKMTDGHYTVQVGVFGAKATRKNEEVGGEGLTNAEIGLIHEMGSVSRKIPRRSFLWDTFASKGKELTLALKKDSEELFKKGKVDEYLKRVGIEAVNLVVEAFHTGGWGNWAPNAYRTLLHKLKGSLKKRKGILAQIYAGLGGNTPLTDSGQLWQAISSRTAKA